MKNFLRLLTLAALAALPLVGRAQGTYTSTAGGGPSTTDLTFNSALQTFSGFSNITDVSWTVNNQSGTTQLANFNLYYAQWNAGTGTASSALTLFGSPGSASILGSSAGNLTFSAGIAGITLSPSQTYVFVLSNTNGGFFNALSGNTPGGADATFFGTGGIASVGANESFGGTTSGIQTALSSPTSIATAYAYQMSVDGTAGLSAVPEPKTAAAEVAALFVAALVGRRVWQRRKVAVSPLAA